MVFFYGIGMNRIWIIAALVWGGAANGWAACDAGFYLNDNGACVKCSGGYYCPGDDTRRACPTDTTDWHARVSPLYPVDKLDVRDLMSWHPSDDSRGAVYNVHCFTGVTVHSPFGILYIESPYNGTDYWNGQSKFLWYQANPGYYLAQYLYTSYRAWYLYARQCTNAPANAHYTGAGTPAQSDSSPTNDCPWECDTGYGNHDGTCVPLCGAGIGKIKTGNGRTFNLYPVAYTTPSLRIGYGGQTCYGVLKSGAAASINVRYNNQTYHLSD